MGEGWFLRADSGFAILASSFSIRVDARASAAHPSPRHKIEFLDRLFERNHFAQETLFPNQNCYVQETLFPSQNRLAQSFSRIHPVEIPVTACPGFAMADRKAVAWEHLFVVGNRFGVDVFR